MSEVDDRGVAALGEDSVLAGSRGRGDGDGNTAVRAKLAQAAAPPRRAAIPDPEVSARPKRRRFSAAYKARIVEEAEGLC